MKWPAGRASHRLAFAFSVYDARTTFATVRQDVERVRALARPLRGNPQKQNKNLQHQLKQEQEQEQEQG